MMLMQLCTMWEVYENGTAAKCALNKEIYTCTAEITGIDDEMKVT